MCWLGLAAAMPICRRYQSRSIAWGLFFMSEASESSAIRTPFPDAWKHWPNIFVMWAPSIMSGGNGEHERCALSEAVVQSFDTRAAGLRGHARTETALGNRFK